MYEHLNDNNLLTEKQSWYRPGHSTHIQLSYLTHQMYSALNESNDFTAVFLDISKYFDKIWHLVWLKNVKYNTTFLDLSLNDWQHTIPIVHRQFVLETIHQHPQKFSPAARRAQFLDLCWQLCILMTYQEKLIMTLSFMLTIPLSTHPILMAAKMTYN